MKRLVDTDDGGFAACLGDKICVYCGVYIYAGTLSGVSDDHVELTSPEIVYETGKLDEGAWTVAESLPSPWRVMRGAIESWGPAKC